MKNEYLFKDGKIIVTDDRLGQIEYEYHDEIDKELITENIIERIQISLESAKYALGHQEAIMMKKYNNKKKYLRYILNFLISTIITGGVGLLIFGNVIATIVFVVLGAMIGTTLNQGESEGCDKVKSKINALIVQIGELNNKLIDEKQKLNQIRVSKKVSREKQIDDIDFKKSNQFNLNKLLKLENVWCHVGYNIKDYYNYEQKGVLRNVLHDEYTHSGELDEVERITKSYGPILIRRLIPQRHSKKQ